MQIMLPDAKTVEIARAAYFVAQTYGLGYPNHPQTWAEWMRLSANACDDFWDMAQDNLDVPDNERMDMPLDLDVDGIMLAG